MRPRLTYKLFVFSLLIGSLVLGCDSPKSQVTVLGQIGTEVESRGSISIDSWRELYKNTPELVENAEFEEWATDNSDDRVYFIEERAIGIFRWTQLQDDTGSIALHCSQKHKNRCRVFCQKIAFALKQPYVDVNPK